MGLFCPKCQKTMAETNFYTYPNGTKCEICKSCLTMHINTYEEDTFLWIMQKFDIPYVPQEWKRRREAEFTKAYNKAKLSGSKDPESAAYNMTKGNAVVFGKYLAQMKLKQWKKYHWADTEKIKQELEEKNKKFEESAEGQALKEQQESIKEAYENGEISEAQYKTYLDINPVIEPPKSLEDQFLDAGGASKAESGPTAGFGNTNPYPENEHPYEVIDVPDPGAELTEEDKLYLAMKWGRFYTAADWVWLEKKYNDFMESFDIQGAARIDTLLMICKTSLKMNAAIDSGDFDTYQKLSRVYDAMMKSAKFTEAQRKEEKSGEFDSVGQIVFFAEKEKGKIGRHEFEYEGDIIDEAINNLKRYNRELIESDTALAQQIENYLKRRASAEEHAADLAEAEKMGLDYVPLKDEDFLELKEAEHQDKLEDQANFIEEESEDES